LPPPSVKERGGFVWPALNLPGPSRDEDTASFFGGEYTCMTSVRPDSTDPIPLRASPHRMGTILIRFVGLLVVAVVVLALAWR
jgi:hypothetical protein